MFPAQVRTGWWQLCAIIHLDFTMAGFYIDTVNVYNTCLKNMLQWSKHLYAKLILANTVFSWISARSRISAPLPPIFRGNWGTSKRQRSSPYVKSPPRSNKIKYLSSCHVCKPVLNSAISAVLSHSHCSYSPLDRTIDQLTIFSRAGCCGKRLKHAEQRECEGAIMVITLWSAIIEGCGYTDVWQHPFYRKFSQTLPAPCA